MRPLYLILFIFSICTLYAQPSLQLEETEAQLNKILEVTQAPSFAVAVVKGSDIIYSNAFGYRDFEGKIKANTSTLYAIGSSTKAFTSAILGQLRHQGELSFDDSPIDYVPDLRFNDGDLNSHVTIKDLMCHRTGIPRHDFSWYLFPTNDRDSLIARIEYQEPFTGLREQWYYNNFMFLVQGVIGEKITGKSWEENIEERFFKPLNMARSNTTIQEMKDASNAALGYHLEKDSIIKKMDYYDIAAMSPAGSINSSVDDMAQWVKLWINGGKRDTVQLIPESYVVEAMSSQMVVSGSLPNDKFSDIFMATYGYGWFMTSYKGHYRVEHGGNIDGFSANVSFFPSDSTGIVVLTNQNGSAVPYMVRNTIADHVLGVNQTDWAQYFLDDKAEQQEETSAGDTESSDQISNTTPSHSAIEYTGTYSHPGYGDFEIELINDSLFVRLRLGTLYLGHYHYDVFEPFDVTDEGIDSTALLSLKINFSTNNSGDISGLSMQIEPTLDPIEFRRTPTGIAVSSEALEELTGEFELGVMTVKTYTKDTNVLYLFVAGQPEYELVPIETDKFSFKSLDGFKVGFNRDDSGRVESITLFQPNGVFTATKKE